MYWYTVFIKFLLTVQSVSVTGGGTLYWLTVAKMVVLQNHSFLNVTFFSASHHNIPVVPWPLSPMTVLQCDELGTPLFCLVFLLIS